jgi:hypothetical protein
MAAFICFCVDGIRPPGALSKLDDIVEPTLSTPHDNSAPIRAAAGQFPESAPWCYRRAI